MKIALTSFSMTCLISALCFWASQSYGVPLMLILLSVGFLMMIIYFVGVTYYTPPKK